MEAGDVLAGILAATTPSPGQDIRHPREGGDPWTLDASGRELDSHPGGNGESTFPARHIHLTRGYRQSASLDLAPLAAAVREGDTATALSLLRSGQLSGVHFHEGNADPLQAHRDHLLAHWTALADTTDPAEALALAEAEIREDSVRLRYLVLFLHQLRLERIENQIVGPFVLADLLRVELEAEAAYYRQQTGLAEAA